MLTCGIYLVYFVYQLVRRSRDHDLRRLELLDAANTVAWERASAKGWRELRPNFERVASTSRGCAGSPASSATRVWLVLTIIAQGIVQIVPSSCSTATS